MHYNCLYYGDFMLILRVKRNFLPEKPHISAFFCDFRLSPDFAFSVLPARRRAVESAAMRRIGAGRYFSASSRRRAGSTRCVGWQSARFSCG